MAFANSERSFLVSEQYESKMHCQVNENDIIDDSSLLVVMDRYSSEINKNQTDSFSNISAIKSIKDLTSVSRDVEKCKYLNIDSFRQILKIETVGHSKQVVVDTIRQIEKMNGVLWVGPNGYDSPASLPAAASGSRYPLQWGIHGNYGINAENTWNYTTGTNIRVGVIDSGIASHSDLLPNVVAGWDFENDESVTYDDVIGHGTHVAGIIGAAGVAANGVIGVSWNIQVIPLQVSNGTLWPIDAVTSAITWAINNDIDILNYSGGGTSDNIARRTAIENYQGLFVCAAGNNSWNNDSRSFYPSNYSYGQSFSSRVISVGAIDHVGEIASFSSYGEESVSIFAPGANILSTVPVGLDVSGYSYMSGTSMATPHVTGAAALLLSVCPQMTPALLKQALMQNVVVSSALINRCVSGGRLDIFNTLSYNFHSYDYTNLGLHEGHNKECPICGSSSTEAHSWTEFLTFFQCSKCGCRSAFIPIYYDNEQNSEQLRYYFSTYASTYPYRVSDFTFLCKTNNIFYLSKALTAEVALSQIT